MASERKDREGLINYDRKRARRTLDASLWIIHLATMLSLLATSAAPGHTARNFIGSGVAFLGSLVARIFWLAHREKTVTHIFAAMFTVAAAGSVLGNGLHVPGVTGAFIGVAVAGYLLGLRWGGFYGVLCILAVSGGYGLPLTRHRPPMDIPVFAWGNVLFIFLLLSCVVAVIPGRGIYIAYSRFLRERKKLSNSIRERKRRSVELERTVGRRTASLAEANADLERFPLALAHDLRTPLQAISGYTAILDATVEDEPQKAALRELQDSVTSMEKALNAALHSAEVRHE